MAFKEKDTSSARYTKSGFGAKSSERKQVGAKGKALSNKKEEKGYKHQHTLEGIRKSLRGEKISYGEISELGKHRKHLIKSGDTELAEAAGIPEHEFNRKRR